MKKPQKRPNLKPVRAEVSQLSHDGRGIALINGKTTFIRGALPGEEVIFQYTRSHSRFDEGQVMEVLRASAERVTPPCKYVQQCGGCSLQHLQTEKQLEFKQTTLLQQLKHIGQVQPEYLLPPIAGPQLGYRTKARLAVKFDPKIKRIILGFREAHDANKIVAIDQCVVLHPKVGEHIAEIRELINQLAAKRYMTHLEVAVSDHNEVALVFGHAAPLSDVDQQKLIIFAQTHNFRIYLQPKDKASIYLFYPAADNDLLSYHLNLAGDSMAKRIGLEIEFHPTDFTQINYQINQQMIERAIELLALSASDNVLDLFCGLGNFSLPMARVCQEVVGVEGDRQTVARATMNAQKNQIHNAKFYSADLTLPLSKHSSWLNQRYNKLLLDPPRTGALELMTQLDCFKAEKIVYVSCNPATMARDAKILVHQHGYRLKTVGIMDMFPHTGHVESIALFEH